MLYLSWILLYFEALSGLRINLDKSVILLVGIVENFNQLACELGCRIGSLPSSYLGLPLGFKLNSSRVWEGLRRDSEEGSPLGRDSLSRKGEDLRLSKARCPIYLYTYCHFVGCPRVSKTYGRNFREIFSGEEALQLEKST